MFKMKTRKPNRLRNYDYSQCGAYFITILTKKRANYFGKIVSGKMILNRFGKIADDLFKGLPKAFMDVVIDKYRVMPNHIHAIIFLSDPRVRDAYSKSKKKEFPTDRITESVNNTWTSNMRPLREYPVKVRSKMKLSKIIQIYKSAVSLQIRKYVPTFEWHRSFHDHIIRNEKDYDNIWQYIHYNAEKEDWDI